MRDSEEALGTDDVTQRIVDKIIEAVHAAARIPPHQLGRQSVLVGRAAVIRSLELVEVLLELEEYCERVLGVELDWTSDAAMSGRRSPFRTVGSLADHMSRAAVGR